MRMMEKSEGRAGEKRKKSGMVKESKRSK